MNSATIPKAVITGMVGGVLAGLFGVGGGLVMVPIFVSWLRLNRKKSHATSLVAIAAISAVAAIGYALAGNVSWGSAGALLVGSLCGAVIGARYLRVIPKQRLQIIFILILLVTAMRLLYSDQPSHLLHGTLSYLVLVLAGICAGVLSGLLGVGGGIVMIPVLMLATGTSSIVARGTSLVVIIGTAITGAITHHRHDLLDWRVALWSITGGVPSTLLGVYLSHELSSRLVVTLFASLIIGVAALQIKELTAKGEERSRDF